MRIIAGDLGGRRLVAPRGARTRPTSDRVREALFAVLGDLEGARVLDLYAGTGALALEALSRGARSAVLVERDRDALEAIATNVRALGQDERAQVVGLPVERARRALAPHAPFDLVLCDPPWPELAHALRTLERLPWAEWLAPGGRLIVEHPGGAVPAPPRPLEVEQHRRWGDTGASWWRVAATPLSSPAHER